MKGMRTKQLHAALAHRALAGGTEQLRADQLA